MPWTPRQVRYLESSGSPLSSTQKAKMNSELHADPSLGHNKKGSEAMTKAPASHEPMKGMRIEFHRGHGGKVTGATVHHHMMSKPSKSAAFMEDTHHSFPFSADQHEEMMDHVHEHSAGQMGAGAAAPKEQPAGANQMEEEAGEGE